RRLSAHAKSVAAAGAALVLELGAGFPAGLAGERHRANCARSFVESTEHRPGLADRRGLRNRGRRSLYHCSDNFDNDYLARETILTRRRTRRDDRQCLEAGY